MNETPKKSEEINLSLVNEQPAPAIKLGWLRALLFIFASLISSFITTGIGLIVVILVSDVDQSLLFTDASKFLKELGAFSTTIVSLFGLGGQFLAVWIFRRFIDKKSFTSLGFSFSNYKIDLNVGMLWGGGLITIGFLILYFSGILTITELNFDLPLLLTYLLMFFIASLNEEIMVRGYILNNLMQSMNKYIALVISSIVFAVLHLANANISPVAFVNLFLAGILLGIYYIHKKNLWFSIGMHLTWNFFQGPVFGFEVSGIETEGIITQDIQGHELITGGEFGLEGSLITTIMMIVIIIIIHLKYSRMK